MNFVLFAWFISSDAFGHLININMDLKTLLYEDRIREMESDLLPFAFIEDNKPNDVYDNLIQQQKEWNNL